MGKKTYILLQLVIYVIISTQIQPVRDYMEYTHKKKTYGARPQAMANDLRLQS